MYVCKEKHTAKQRPIPFYAVKLIMNDSSGFSQLEPRILADRPTAMFSRLAHPVGTR